MADFFPWLLSYFRLILTKLDSATIGTYAGFSFSYLDAVFSLLVFAFFACLFWKGARG